jgi:predicted NBD/HSP70 family sugar kinase
VSSIATDLLESELVVETGSLTTEKGRKPTGLTFNPRAKAACGIAIDDQHNISVVVADMNGNLIGSNTITGASELSESEALLKLTKEAMHQFGYDSSRLCALGLAIPGPIAQTSEYFAIADALSSKLKTQVSLQSLVDMAAIAEASTSKLPDDKLILFARTSHQLRSTLLMGRKLLFMHAEVGGDPGHIPAPWIPDVCSCGNTGCVNTFVGSEQILRRVRAKGVDVGSFSELLLALTEGHPQCIEVIAEAGAAAGYAIGCLINVLAPINVIVSGAATEAGDLFWTPFKESCEKYATARNFAACELRPSTLGVDSPALGAALYSLAENPVLGC